MFSRRTSWSVTPRMISRYQLLEQLGQGGMGTVYLALDPALERQVALKLLSLPGGQERRRFRREVQVAARLSHRHIVTIYDVGLENDPPFVVMELLTGGTLETYFKDHYLTWREALKLLQPLCQAVTYAHQMGVIHRDIKPANVLFSGGAEQTLKLADFGLARRQGSEQLTRDGAVMGTLGYMSPEQATGQQVTSATDIFAIGIILYEAIAGFNPLRGQNWSDTLARITAPEPIDLRPLENKAPAGVITLISNAVAKDQRKRYQDARLLEQDIAQVLSQDVELDLSPTIADFTPTRKELQIENPAGLSLPPGGTEILCAMFAGYGRLAIKDELVGGRSGGRIFLVRPIRNDGTPELPAVVKMAPDHLIQQEWRAYQDYVRAQLAGIAEIQDKPVLLPGISWGGLRYPLVGGGDFAIESLYRYCQEASTADIRYLLERRLFKRMGEKWRHNFAVAEFRLGDSYDAILPVNLLIQPVPLPADGSTALLSLEIAGSFQAGDYLQVTEFVVSEVDETGQSVTLNRPSGRQPRFYPSYRLRLHPVADVHQYQVGQPVDLQGMVTATRQDILLAQVRDSLDTQFDITAELLPNGWPNPLHRLSLLMAETMNVRTGHIHGDFNMDNILVDPATREVYLIDFALARHDHVLHDLLRLEKDVITRMLPESLDAAGLTVQALDRFYRWVDEALAQERPPALPAVPHPALEKPLLIVYLIRRAARDLLFNPRQWAEYEAGLILYLLGALKFKDLTAQARQVAFWSAAAVQKRLNEPPVSQGSSLATVGHALGKPARKVRNMIGVGVGLLVFLLLLILAYFVWPGRSDLQPVGDQVASVISLSETVEVRRVDDDQLQAASFGMPLYAGDVVITYQGAAVQILCENGLLFNIPGGSNLTVDCRETDSQLLVARLDTELIQPEPTAEPALVATDTTTQTNQSITPILLTPRNTRIVETEPSFHWQAIPGADFYRLTVIPENGETWQRETEETSLTYPAGVSPLLPGTVNEIVIEAFGEENTREVSELRVLDGASIAALAVDEAAIHSLGLDEATENYLLADLYARNGLLSTAISLLESLTGGSGNQSPYLWRQLGDLYASIGLYDQAEASYQAALMVTPEAQAVISELSPTITPTTISSATPTPTSASTQTPAPLATLPVLPGTPVPQPSTAIDPSNAGEVVALAQWGDRALSEVTCSPDSQTVAVGLANGVALYNSVSLQEERLLGVDSFVQSLAYFPDGQMLASGSAAGTIQLWRPADGEKLDEVGGHIDRVWNIAISADGRWLASGSLDNTVRLWRVEGESLEEQAILEGHSGPVRSVAFSPDGRLLASAADDTTIRLWQVSNSALISTLSGHANTVRSVTFSPDGQRLASGSDDGTVRLWQVSDGTLLRTLTGHVRAVHSVKFSPDGQLLASGGLDTNVRLWRVANGQLLETLAEPVGWVFTVAFCDEGRLLVSGSSDGAIYLWGIAP